MSLASTTTLERWSLRRWLTTVAVILALQLAAIFFLGQRGKTPPTPSPSSGGWTILGAVSPDRLEVEFPLVSDPTLLAIPGLRGFSGNAWLTYRPVPFSFQARPETPDWLALDGASLGGLMLSEIAMNAPGGVSPLRIADLPLPKMMSLDFAPGGTLVATNSQLEVTGALASRVLLTPLSLPSWPHRDVLTNTTVEVLVDAAGHPFVAVVTAGSGLPAADRAARDLAKGARFSSVAGPNILSDVLGTPPFVSGRMIFHWHAITPAEAPTTPPTTAALR